jgi:hypothetical protein
VSQDLLEIAPEPGRELRDGIADLTRIHDETVRTRDSALRTEIQIGHTLLAAKERVRHGGFGEWLEAHTEGFFSELAAQDYLKLAREQGRVEEIRQPNPQRAADLSVREALRALASPRRKGLGQGAAPNDPSPAAGTTPAPTAAPSQGSSEGQSGGPRNQTGVATFVHRCSPPMLHRTSPRARGRPRPTLRETKKARLSTDPVLPRTRGLRRSRSVPG